MKRTTVMLPSDLKSKALKRAHQAGISLGEFIRSSLTFSLKTPLNPSKVDPLWADTMTFSGKAPRDLAKNHDTYLY